MGVESEGALESSEWLDVGCREGIRRIGHSSWAWGLGSCGDPKRGEAN